MSRDTASHAPLFLRCRAGLLAGVLGLTTSTGCHQTFQGMLNPVGPDYCRPLPPVADSFVAQQDPRVTANPSDNPLWWESFGDPALATLIENAYQQNLDLKAAGTRVLQARYMRNIAQGNLFPQQQQLVGAFSRNAQSDNIVNRNVNVNFFDMWETGFNAAWELDFWGRYRRTIEAADAEYTAAIEDYDAILVLLLGDVATTYIEVCTLSQRLEYARQNIEVQSRAVQLADARLAAGRSTELDVEQAKSNLAQTSSTIPDLEASLRQAENRLCVLMGMPPSDITSLVPHPRTIPLAPQDVAVGIPANLVRRRPDVRRAERELAAQSARIGIAASDLYPRIAITGVIGVSANNLSDLFDSDSLTGSIGPGFRWNILNYGRIRNNIEAERAQFCELAANYQQSVLQAALEVENNAVAFTKNQDKNVALQQSVEALERSIALALEQYDAGRTDFDRIFNLQRFLAQQQDRLAVSRGEIAQSLVQTYIALGGGWEYRLNNPSTGGAAATLATPGDPELCGPICRKPEPCSCNPLTHCPPECKSQH